MITPIRVDFYDLRDFQGSIYRFVSELGHVHVGTLVGHLYLLPALGEPSEWKDVSVVDKVMSRYDRISYDLVTDIDPGLVFMAGSGHVVTGKAWNTVTELPCYLKDIGFRIPEIRRTTCASVASTILRAAGVPVTATTARHLHEELRIASRFSGSDPLVTVELQARHELKGGRPQGDRLRKWSILRGRAP